MKADRQKIAAGRARKAYGQGLASVGRDRATALTLGCFGVYLKPFQLWQSMPADRYNRGANFSCTDGSAQQVTWRTPKLPGDLQYDQPAHNDSLPDLRRLQEMIPQRIPLGLISVDQHRFTLMNANEGSDQS